MSGIAERVAAEHVFTSHSESLPGGRIRNSARCSCGHELPWTDRQEAHRSHVFAAHEAAVRAQIAADIVAWPDTPLGRDTLARGAWSDGVRRGLSIAADIAEAGAS